MKVGFTGTRNGMTPKQKKQFKGLIEILRPTEFHHGDCVGADDEAANIVDTWRTEWIDIFQRRVEIIKHPPVKGKFQAHNPHYEEIRPEQPYLERNANIALECDLLIAAPKENREEQRRGTWYTIREAWKRGKTTIILMP